MDLSGGKMHKQIAILIACLALVCVIGCKQEKPEPAAQDSLEAKPAALVDSTLQSVIRVFETSQAEADLAMAVSILRDYAYRNNPEAQFHCGQASWLGRGIEQSEMEAYVWWTIAAGYGYAPAQEKIQGLKNRLPKEDYDEVNNRANDWFEKYRQLDIQAK